MAQVAAVSASSRKTGKRFLGRLGRVLLFAVLIISAGLFMMGTLINVESIMGRNSGTVKECFLVLFAGGILYAVAILYLWYYFALVLTNRWLARLVYRLETETGRPDATLPLSW